jgi:flagellar biosynthesis/type III secretory pathway M-ring protein FliF/YscJ
MGEPTPTAGGRQFLIIATVITVVFFTFFLVGIRSCSMPSVDNEQKVASSHVIIYSNLDLKDAALVITRLKDLKIPYQIKDNGHAIAVPKAKADEARLGLAAKNLPGGGTVGWEIFDQSKLGATDFDRRIQFVRAISGELARTINRISVIEDARVQIVIPETKLFEVSTAPVTASVLLKMKAGESLTRNQVNGIVRLVAGSVENLKPQNVTIVDTNGNILSGTAYRAAAAPEQEEQVLTPREEETPEIVIEKGPVKRSFVNAAAPVKKNNAQMDELFAKAKQYAKAVYRNLGKKTSMAIAGVSVFLFLIMLMLLSGGRKQYPKEYEQASESSVEEEQSQGEDMPVLDNMRTLAAGNPQQVAQLIMRWISEGGS